MKILFVLNSGSGSNKTDWVSIIQDYFKGKEYCIDIFYLPRDCPPDAIKRKISEFQPERAIAVGGDGTVKLLATCLLDTDIILGVLPAGSANGMAKELKIPLDPKQAVDMVINGRIQQISLIKVNEHYCIHLSDIGFNAFMVKKFETGDSRGFWGYLKASWKAIWENPVMQLNINTDGKSIKRSAAMVVLANATSYGTGALINPEGKLNDGYFELIIVKKISVREIFKMKVSHLPFDKDKKEVLNISSLDINTSGKVHFQVDGEYLGEVSDIHAGIIPNALRMLGSHDPIKSLQK
jgi:diacylglycerol kinase (ATP)